VTTQLATYFLIDYTTFVHSEP